MYLGYSYPHDPAKASQDFKGRTNFGEYGDSIHEIDWSVGQLHETLRRKGKLEDTLMIFTSDHGPWFLGDPGMLRGRKGSTFEGGHRVPMIMHWPNGLDADRVQDAWATHLDVLPTLAAWCNLNLPTAPLDGQDMSKVFGGGPDRGDRHSVLYFNPMAAGGKEIHCARKGDWKLRVAQVNGEIYINDWGAGREGFWLAHPELYNVRTDFTESYDVANAHPDIVESILADIRATIPSFPQDVIDTFRKLESNQASATTPPGAAPRLVTHQPQSAWAWEPPERRS
jgi:arylsulfatase